MVKIASHLQLRNGKYYFRMAVPEEFRDHFGRREFKISLQTTRLANAKVASSYMYAKIETHLSEIVKLISRERKNSVDVSLEPDKVQEIARGFFETLLPVSEELALVLPQDPSVDIDEEIEAAEEALGQLQWRIGRHSYDEYLKEEARSLLPTNVGKDDQIDLEDFDYLCHAVLRARAEDMRILLAKLKGRYDEVAPRDPLFRGVECSGPAPLPGEEPVHLKKTVGALIEKFIALKSLTSWVPKTQEEYRRILAIFAEITGNDRSIAAVSIDDVRRCRDTLVNLPSSYSKNKDLQGIGALEVVHQSKDIKKLSLTTIAKYFQYICAFLNWCVDEGYLDKSPAGKLKIQKKTNAIEARNPFSKAQLNEIFTSPQYTGHRSASRRSVPGEMIIRDGKFWIPLIGLFSGMRLGEIVQLRTGDVKLGGDLAYFSISAGDHPEKKLKTASSNRSVPIHPDLLDLGFVDFIEERQAKAPSGRIFAEITASSTGYFSDKFSKYFSRYLTNIGVKTDLTCFHSFRHNFKDGLVNAQVDEARIKALLGHADNSVTAGYGSKMSVEALHPAICAITYDLNLKHIAETACK